MRLSAAEAYQAGKFEIWSSEGRRERPQSTCSGSSAFNDAEHGPRSRPRYRDIGLQQVNGAFELFQQTAGSGDFNGCSLALVGGCAQRVASGHIGLWPLPQLAAQSFMKPRRQELAFEQRGSSGNALGNCGQRLLPKSE
jgi:hypothetical protein